MKQGYFTVVKNEGLTREVYRLELCGDTSAITAPGQFVNLRIEGCYLRRPLSVCDLRGDRLTLIYKTVGAGTRKLSEYAPGGRLELLTGLGNGYDLSVAGDSPLLVGGGVGIPPLYYLCRELMAQGKRAAVIMGFNTASEIFLKEEFEETGAQVIVTTADGSAGLRGFAADAMAGREYSSFYACGPEPMLRAVDAAARPGVPGQLSFEERMGCGFGACMGCSCQTKYGSKRICKEGPVLSREEIIWQTRG